MEGLNNGGQTPAHGNEGSLWDALRRKREDVDYLLGLLADPLLSASARSIALIAYAKKSLEEQEYPFDSSDLERCRKAFRALPVHRRNCHAPNEAMSRAEKTIDYERRAGRLDTAPKRPELPAFLKYLEDSHKIKFSDDVLNGWEESKPEEYR